MNVTAVGDAVIGSITSVLPQVMGMLAILVIGVAVGWLVGRVTKNIIIRFKLDDALSRSRKPLLRISDIFPKVFSWTIYIVTLQAAVDVLGIPAFSSFIGGIIFFIPGLVKAILVVVIGYAVAEYVRTAILKSDVEYADIMANVLFFLIVYMSVVMALPLVGIDPFLVNAIMIIVIAAAAFAVAAALAPSMRKEFDGFFRNYKKTGNKE